MVYILIVIMLNSLPMSTTSPTDDRCLPQTPPGLSSLLYSFTRAFSLSLTKQRTASFDFDAGINTLNAWTEHREHKSVALSIQQQAAAATTADQSPSLLSDDEPDEDEALVPLLSLSWPFFK